jgi:hypothetical protein
MIYGALVTLHSHSKKVHPLNCQLADHYISSGVFERMDRMLRGILPFQYENSPSHGELSVLVDLWMEQEENKLKGVLERAQYKLYTRMNVRNLMGTKSIEKVGFSILSEFARVDTASRLLCQRFISCCVVIFKL